MSTNIFFSKHAIMLCNIEFIVMQVCKVHPALLVRHISTTTNFIEIVALREMSRGPERMKMFGRGGDDSCLESMAS